MLVYLFAIAVVNFSLGFALAAWRARPCTPAPDEKQPETPPVVRETPASHADAASALQDEHHDDLLAADDASPATTSPALDHIFRPTWALDIAACHRGLLSVRDQLVQTSDVSALPAPLEQLEEILRDWLLTARPACQQLENQAGELGECQSQASRLIDTLDAIHGDAEALATRLEAAPAKYEPAAEAQRAQDEIDRLLEKLQVLRDARCEARLAVALETDEFDRLSQEELADPQTQIHNRLGIEIVHRQWLVEHPDQPWSLLVLDIDGFTELNRRLGATQGDRILRAFAGLADDLLRKDRGYDRAARWHADSFILFLGDTDGESAVNAAERIRQTIESSSFALENEEVDLTVSVGVAAGGLDEPLADVLNHAAQAVVAALEQGGNRTWRHGDSGPQAEVPRPYQVKGRIVKIESPKA